MEAVTNFVIPSLLAGTWGVIIVIIKRFKATQNGVKALLRDRIIEAYNRAKDRGCAPIYERESFMDMVEQYYILGGNGVVKDLVDKYLQLPTEPD